MLDVLLISGAGPYADRWHSFPETSRQLASVIEALGYRVEITEDVEARLAAPGRCRLLVVNIGNPGQPRPSSGIAAAEQGLASFLNDDGALLGVHSSATSLTTMPSWPAVLGGQWIRGHSMHPPKGRAQILRTNEPHPITARLTDFVVDDERYSYLATAPDVTVLYEHEYAGLRHPLVWARQAGRSRVVYDGLGHDTTSFDSAGRVALIQHSVRWLLRDLEISGEP